MLTVSAKLYPTKGQERSLDRCLRVCCWVYNRSLEQRIKAWKRRKESSSLYSQCAMLTGWRSRVEWLREVPAHAERDALRRVDRGMKAFFRRLRSGEKPGFPKFKSARRWRSMEILQPGRYLRGNRVHVPGVGKVRFRGMQEFVGCVRGLRVIRRASGWFVQLIVDDGDPPPTKQIESAVGIDMGLSKLATLSNGESLDNPRWYSRSQRKLAKLQRVASRRKRGSKRRDKAYSRVARQHARVADSRRDWLHKQTRRLADDYDLIAVEKLNVRGMSRSRLAKSILDASWSEFVRQLEYKTADRGKLLVKVDPRGTSQECSECGRVVPKSLSVRVHECPCGYTADRDVNAAKNVLNRVPRVPGEMTLGESALAGGKVPRRGSLNREALQTFLQRKTNEGP